MKSHATEKILPENPRFHLPKGDGLFLPIPFLFVTERMQGDILSERAVILGSLPSPAREQQIKIFERYDPKSSFDAFQDILRLFGVEQES
ncbi:hypothetical protein [Thauera sinica]|uniref:Uncharacterized protein n=1 Tax=Thauera sinica TaxID=2665146 RepID=A0ABW1AR57_9RHOO|nr:hypothetical protein [Thauera sp. K11]ATE60124.1 hypothetical protein CCZ27_09325 [Thauera sp. K11]